MMSVLELDEFSSFEKIGKFLRTEELKGFIDNNFEDDPIYIAIDGQLGGTTIEFSRYPIEICVTQGPELAVFFDFRAVKQFEFKILGFIEKDTLPSAVIACLGTPDFEIDENKRIKLNHTARIIKYFIDDEYSISFDYNNQIELVRIFKDKFR